MFLNPYTLKKYGAFVLAGFLPLVSFMMTMLYYKNVWIGLSVSMVALVISLMLGMLLIKNPFTSMLEGKGLLVFDISSTGIIHPFIMWLEQPYIKGVLNKKPIADIYDRSCVYNLAAPQEFGKPINKLNPFNWFKKKVELKTNITEDSEVILQPSEIGKAILDEKKDMISLKLKLDEYHKNKFGLLQYPVLIYNSQIGSLISKDFLADQEKFVFAEHLLLYLNRKIEELNSLMRDFVRYIVEQLKPKGQGFLAGKGWILWIIVIAGFIVLAALFARPVYESIMGFGTNALDTAGSATGGIVTPK